MGKNNVETKKLSFLKVIGIELLVLLPILFIFLRGKLKTEVFLFYIFTMLISFSLLFYFINGNSFKDMEYKEYEKILKPYFVLVLLGVNISGVLAIGLYTAFTI